MDMKTENINAFKFLFDIRNLYTLISKSKYSKLSQYNLS
jgi:hypothetical protein